MRRAGRVVARAAFAPVDASSLVAFRVAFGLLMVWEVWRYFDHGWIHRYWIEPSFHFRYLGFDFVRPLPGDGMYVLFGALGLLALCIALGFGYRFAAAAFFVGFTYTFLLEQARYLNHFYLVCLLAFLLIFVPAHRYAALDAWLRPWTRSRTVPAWSLWILRAQVGIVYTFAGIAKLNGDWLRGEPMRSWLASRTDFPLLGPLFTREEVVYLFAYGGLLLDLLALPLLLWRRTRLALFLLLVLFHLMNARLFGIGIFPYLSIAMTLLFFPPEWPRRVLAGLGGRWAHGGRTRRKMSAPPAGRVGGRRVLAAVALYLAIQVVVPLRHHLYPGNVAWTEQGHRFSWRMMLRAKRADARLYATDPVTKRTWEIDLRDHLRPWQERAMGGRPDMVHQLAVHLADDLRDGGAGDVMVWAYVKTRLNGRPAALMIDPFVDLAAQPRTWRPSSWIVPLGR